METVDRRTPEREDYDPLKEPTEFIVSEDVSMIVEEGEITFIDYKTNQTVTMTEWDFSEVDLAYLHARLEERNPVIKANRLAREKYEAEQQEKSA
jgi:hypothetical protein